MGSQQQCPKDVILLHVCGKLQGHDGPAHRSTLLPHVSQHLLFHCSREGQAPFQHWGQPSQGAHTHVCLLHPAAACQYVQGPQAATLLVIPWGAQYDHLLPKIMMLCNHQVLLVDLSMGEPFPLVPVGDFQLEDNIFPGTPGDSLLYTSKELMKLQKLRFQVTMHCPAQTLVVHHEDETSQLSHSSGEVPSSTNKNGDPLKATGSLGRKSSHHKHSPPLKEHHGSHDKDWHSSSSKHWEKPRKDKEDSKSPCKCPASPAQGSSTKQAEKEPCLEGHPMVFNA